MSTLVMGKLLESEAHGGDMRIESRKAGGLAVTLSLPGPTPQKLGSRARLTLSRV